LEYRVFPPLPLFLTPLVVLWFLPFRRGCRLFASASSRSPSLLLPPGYYFIIVPSPGPLSGAPTAFLLDERNSTGLAFLLFLSQALSPQGVIGTLRNPLSSDWVLFRPEKVPLLIHNQPRALLSALFGPHFFFRGLPSWLSFQLRPFFPTIARNFLSLIYPSDTTSLQETSL